MSTLEINDVSTGKYNLFILPLKFMDKSIIVSRLLLTQLLYLQMIQDLINWAENYIDWGPL